MMAPEYYVFTGRVGEVISRHVTHVLIAEALKFVPARAFMRHPNIQEVICHDGVEKIEEAAFFMCPSLRRIIMPGLKEIEQAAFACCDALSYIECGKLEVVGFGAFGNCQSLSSVVLPSIKIVEGSAFQGCTNLINVKFGKDLESIRRQAFYICKLLERITLPLKDDMLTSDNIFQRCANLNHVDLVGGVHETIAALLMDEWKHDMNEEIDTIRQNLASAHAGNVVNDAGGKAQAIRTWMRSVLSKIVHYKSEHLNNLNVADAALHPALPNDIVLKSIFPFLELPSHTFEGED